MARKPSSSGTIEAFSGVKPIGPAQTTSSSTNARMARNPAEKPTRMSPPRQPGQSAWCDASSNLSILRSGK